MAKIETRRAGGHFPPPSPFFFLSFLQEGPRRGASLPFPRSLAHQNSCGLWRPKATAQLPYRKEYGTIYISSCGSMGDSAASEPVLALHSQLGSGSPMGESTHSEPGSGIDGAGARQPLPLGCLGSPNCSIGASLRLPGWRGPGRSEPGSRQPLPNPSGKRFRLSLHWSLSVLIG